MVGSVEPRIWTPPLRELTPATSYGFEFAEFAAEIGRPLLPWQRWLAIHAGELLADGRPRFRKILVLVGRQNGKTFLLALLALYWLIVLRTETVVGTSTKLEYAQDAWQAAVKIALATPELKQYLPAKAPHGVRRTNGSVGLTTLDECEYRIAPANEEGGRSKTIGLAILDELRQHYDYSAWDAIVPATNAVRFAQAWALSNAGSDRSVVLNETRDTAIAGVDDRLGIFEYSAPEGADPEDPAALCAANPSVGHRPGSDLDVLLSDARAAKLAGGKKLAGFRTEVMCQRVRNEAPAINPEKWHECLDVGDLAGVPRGRVVLAVDLSLDEQHATLVAAAVLPDGRVRVEPLDAWSGSTAGRDLAAGLPEHVRRIQPGAVGWLPSGPAAAIGADLSARKGAAMWLPAGVTLEPVRGEVTAVCMGFASLVGSGGIAHSDDPLLNAQVAATVQLRVGDAWRFVRRGAGHCDAVYAAAAAVHLARTLPPDPGPPRLVLPSGTRSSS